LNTSLNIAFSFTVNSPLIRSATVGRRSVKGAGRKKDAWTSDQVQYRESSILINFKCLTGVHIRNMQEVRSMTKIDAERNSSFLHTNEMRQQLSLASSSFSTLARALTTGSRQNVLLSRLHLQDSIGTSSFQPT